MRRWLKTSWLCMAIIALVACDLRGRAYEDLRLMRLTEGESTEQDVRNLFGAPSAVRDAQGGKGLVYPLGPEGPYTLLIKIDSNGKYRGRDNLLTRANFERVTNGMKDVDVLVMLGRPGRAEKYPLKQQSAWEWRFVDGASERMFVVTFDSGGRVFSSAIEEDPRRVGGR